MKPRERYHWLRRKAWLGIGIAASRLHTPLGDRIWKRSVKGLLGAARAQCRAQ